MFVQLKSLIDSCVSVSIILTGGKDGLVNVAVIPKVENGKDAALATPLALSGTLEELDEQFAGLCTSFVNKRLSLAEQLEATTTILEAAKQESAKKAVKGKAKTSTSSAAACCVADDDGDDDDDVSAEVSTTSTPATPAAPMDDLWS